MKKITGFLLSTVLLACLIIAPAQSVFADAVIYDYYSVDYYVIVDAPDGYVNLRLGPSIYESIKTPIYNGQVLHITYETYYDPNIDAKWGKTNYNGTWGWVSLSQCSSYDYTPAASEVNYDDYFVVVSAPDNYVNFRDYPGLSGNIICAINNGVKLHITAKSEYDSTIGACWGKTNYNGKNGWVSLSQCTVCSTPTSAETEAETTTWQQPETTEVETTANETTAEHDLALKECLSDVQDNQELKDFLVKFTSSYTNFAENEDDATARTEYDSKATKDGDAAIIANIIGTPECVDWSLYPVDELQTIWEASDPLEKASVGYKTSTLDAITWIAENIFHADEKAITEFSQNGYSMFSDDTDVYCVDGIVYAVTSGIGGWNYKAEIVAANRIDTLYYITYDFYTAASLDEGMQYDGVTPDRYYAVLEKKSIDGKEYWTMYSNSMQTEYNFDDVPMEFLLK